MENPPRGLPGLRPDPWSLLLLHLDLASGPWGGMALLRRVTPPRGRGTSPRRHLVAGLVPPTAVSLSSTATPAFTSAGALGQTFSLAHLTSLSLGVLGPFIPFYLASLYVFNLLHALLNILASLGDLWSYFASSILVFTTPSTLSRCLLRSYGQLFLMRA